MSLTKEKEKLLQLVVEKDHDEKFSSFEYDSPTYYLRYTKSKHTNAPLVAYDSTEAARFKHDLMGLWADDEFKKKVIPVIQIGIRKSLKEPEKKLGDIDLYNYMM